VTWRPRLRARLSVTDAGVLVDPVPGRDVQLSPVSAALARRLDGELALDEVLAAVAGEGHARAEAETGLRWLLLCHAVEGAGDATAAKLERVVRGEEALPLVLLDGARFECQGSGGCCHQYRFGPVGDDDIARLEALDLDAAFPGRAPWVVGDEEGRRYLRSVDDACVFLEDGHRCGVHARFGAAAKPRVCQLYPLEPHATLAGLGLSDQGGCARFAESSQRGLPLHQDLARLLPLLEGAHHLFHPLITIDGVPCDFGVYLEWRQAALALVKTARAPAAACLAAIGDGLARVRAALLGCALAAGQPDEAVAAVVGDAAAWGGAEPGGAAALTELLDTLAAALAATGGGAAVHDGLALCRAVADEVRSGAAAPPLDDEVHGLLRLSLRQQLFGARATMQQRAAAGLVRIAVIQALAAGGARGAARVAGRDHAGAADLSRPHMLAVRLFEQPVLERILLERERGWRAVLEALPALVGAS
jgi:Fe-S-cluster containining protein